MSVNAIDLATKLTDATASMLSQNNVQYVGRYLSKSSWKGIDAAEVAAIKKAGMQIISIYETNPTHAEYFTASQGKFDANDAYNLAKGIGQPENTVIYFTVDYDAPAKDYPAILSYFQAVKSNLKGYKMGAYGCHSVLTFLNFNGIADYYYQTCAWSYGQHTAFNSLYQFQCDKQYLGLNVDFVNLEKTEVGAWGQEAKVLDAQTTIGKPVMVVKVLCDTDIRSNPSHTAGFIRNAQKDEILNVWEIQDDWHRVAAIPEQNVFGWIDGNNGKNLYWVNNPNLSQPLTVYHTVVAGDTVGKLAQSNKVTIDQIKAWNNLDSNCTIFIGKNIRVK